MLLNVRELQAKSWRSTTVFWGNQRLGYNRGHLCRDSHSERLGIELRSMPVIRRIATDLNVRCEWRGESARRSSMISKCGATYCIAWRPRVRGGAVALARPPHGCTASIGPSLSLVTVISPSTGGCSVRLDRGETRTGHVLRLFLYLPRRRSNCRKCPRTRPAGRLCQNSHMLKCPK